MCTKQDTAPWIILVNGLFAGLESYDKPIEDLKDEFNILRYDCRGQGKSPKPPGIYKLSDHVLDLKNLVLKLELDQFIILGLSNGARIALEYAKENPTSVLAVVACDTYPSVSELLKLKLQSWLSAYELGGAFHRFDITTPWIFGESIIREKPELISFYKERAKDMEEHAFNGLVRGAMEGHVSIDKLSCPILLLVGEEDVLTPPYLHQQMYETCKRNSKMNTFSIIRGGHASLIEYPEAIKNNVLPFLRSLF